MSRRVSVDLGVTMSDFFCGAGGSSSGATQVEGVQLVVAANHWQLACEVHNLNHPGADHSVADLHQENPAFFPTTDIAWFSPECTKWSQANATPMPAIEAGLFEDPLSNEAAVRSRLLMFDVLRFAEYHRYRLMIVENVVDIATQTRYRLAWHEWQRALRALGYHYRVVSLNSMHAQTYGPPAPQSRDRIYIVCWRVGDRAPDLDRILRPRAYCTRCARDIEAAQAFKPGRTVGKYRQQYLYVHPACGTTVEPAWLPAYTALDLTTPGTPIGDRLKPKTRARILTGIARYWLTVPTIPGLAVPTEGREGKVASPLDRPLRTQTTRLETGLAHVAPFVAELRGGSSCARSTTDPLATLTAGGLHHGLAVPPTYPRADHAGGPPALIVPAGGTWNSQARPGADPLRALTSREAYALAYHHTPNPPTSDGGSPDDALFELHDTPPARAITDAALRAAEELLPEVLFRMFLHREAAAAMAFPADYRWDVLTTEGRPPTKRDLTKMTGNAVTPPSSRDTVAVSVAALTGEDLAVAA